MAGKRIIVFALLALVAVALAMSVQGDAKAQTYKPYTSYSLTNTAPGANSDSSVAFSVAAPDVNYEDASMTILLPLDGLTANGLEALIGAKVGTLPAKAAVGLLGGPCNQALSPNFNLYNASVDIADQLGPGDGDGDGKGDTEWILKKSSDWPVPKSQGNVLLEDYLEKYPWFLNTMLDPDGAGIKLPIQPKARFAGHTSVAGFNVLVQFLVFNPGDMTAAGGVYTQMTAEKGSPSYIVLDNPIGEGEATPGAIADFCTPLITTTNLLGTTLNNPATGTGGGVVRYTNPPVGTGILGTGTQMEWNYSQSERNVDGDLFENDLDACRYTADTALWNPRVKAACVVGSQPGDQDCDMLSTSCDPNDGAEDGCGSGTCYDNIDNGPLCNGAGSDGKDAADTDCADGTANDIDADNDGYDNAQDNCPLVANGCKDATCSAGAPFDPTWDNQEDTDSGLTNTDQGPRTDALGDSCDDSDDDGDEDGAGGLAGPGSCNDGLDNDGNEDGAGAGTCADTIDNGGLDGADSADSDCFDADGRDADCVPKMDKADKPTLGNPAQPHNGAYFHGYPWAAACVGSTDTDLDGYCDLLEGAQGSPINNGAETGAQCTDALDNETGGPDGYINDGCPIRGDFAETGAQCAAGDNVSDDTPTPDWQENTDYGPANRVNDGCPVMGVPESKIIDATMTAAAAEPPTTAAQSCSDGIDNDLDGATDAADSSCATWSGDPDLDGWADVLANGFGDEITGDHVGDETYTGASGLAVGASTYNATTGAITVGTNGGECWIVAPGQEDVTWDAPGDSADLEVQVFCDGAFLLNRARADLDGDGDDDAYWHNLGDVADALRPTGQDNCPAKWNPTQTNTDAKLVAAGASIVADAPPTKGDACDTDDDNDGYLDDVEAYLPTDPLDNCRNPAPSSAPTPRSDAWGLDINRDGFVTIPGDVATFAGKINAQVSITPPTTWTLSRWDLNKDDYVTIPGDVSKFAGKINLPCT